MTWKLWLDDQLDDKDTPSRWIRPGYIGARSTYDAMILVKVKGLPEYIDFDHDLGHEDTAINFINQLIEIYPNGPVPEYQIHSENPVGAKNIISKMYSWKKSINV